MTDNTRPRGIWYMKRIGGEMRPGGWRDSRYHLPARLTINVFATSKKDYMIKDDPTRKQAHEQIKIAKVIDRMFKDPDRELVAIISRKGKNVKVEISGVPDETVLDGLERALAVAREMVKQG